MNIQIEENGVKVNLTAEDKEKIIERLKDNGLRVHQQKIVEVLLKISDGRFHFRASYKSLSEFLYQKTEDRKQQHNNRGKVRNLLRGLEKWQNESCIEVIKVEEGTKKPTSNGQFDYYESKFEFVLLEDLVKRMRLYPDEGFETSLDKVIERSRDTYEPTERFNPVSSEAQIKRDKKTAITKIKKVFDAIAENGGDAQVECGEVLNEANFLLNEWSDDLREIQNRKKRIEKFESRIRESRRLFTDKSLS